jgi:hypothetical protein
VLTYNVLSPCWALAPLVLPTLLVIAFSTIFAGHVCKQLASHVGYLSSGHSISLMRLQPNCPLGSDWIQELAAHWMLISTPLIQIVLCGHYLSVDSDVVTCFSDSNPVYV